MRHMRFATAWWFAMTTFFLAWVIGLENGVKDLALQSWFAAAFIAMVAEGFAIRLTEKHQHGGWWALVIAALYFGVRPVNFWLSLLCVALGGLAGLLFAQPFYRWYVTEKYTTSTGTEVFRRFFDKGRMTVVDKAA